ncbi:putative nucleotidyltransferase substrate binding domain-containing protein [Gymnodinialimonas ceratoperidinii]|uniref:Glutamine-synthetase adenylyltransferase n=1 Tax=Gymnodinialimonas ceratoperidinii TaxID=2856823 RepID=A0A8F6TTK8_9RHOB|nr:putative nucleotidyltransferase substrate binding domain-containing protein [Gymnodinialimonas ceratoperidinii]QXT38465.1 glutamine-synthetase adenylyltransferase [Gymnodinialimonas ceratoperidinii]
MPFAARLTRSPLAHAPDRGDEALTHTHDLAPELAELIRGAAGSSPYLAELIRKEGHWLSHALEAEPEEVIQGLIEDTRTFDLKTIDAGLRQLKRRAALIVGLADLGGVWGLATLTQAWTDFADACVAAALCVHVAAQARRGKIPGQREEDAFRDGAGMVALAMGKMGAGELNYSSDIDLICLFDETRFDGPAEEMEARAGFIRATRAMAATLNDPTEEGYVFRTDLRLRPDASVTPVCISMAAAERYYEGEGRTWERSAYIKARPAAGHIAAGEKFLTALTPFVWRKHLDFAAVAETMDMRQRIRDHKGLHGMALEGRNLKLGYGGIREIEFFAQTRQLVAGGRDPSLRQPRTVKALAALARAEWITRDDASALADHYAALREAEHRLQMIDDAQTHSLPKTPEGFDRLARLSGEGDTARYRAALEDRLAAVAELTSDLYASKSGTSVAPTLSEEAQAIVARWPGYPALKSARGQAIFERLKPDLLNRFSRSTRPDEALSNFDGFLRGLPAGVQIFSLFDANPSLVDLLVDVCSTAPGPAAYLSRHSRVLDAVLVGDFFSPWPGAAGLREELAEALEPLDYEAQLDTTRRWQKEWLFRVGVHMLRGLIDADDAAQQYSDVAEAVVSGLWPCVCADVARRHGDAPGRGGVVLAMGSLGVREMTATSDLDLIVIFDAQGVEMTEGRRPLDPRGWFAKATKAMITALSARTGEGKLYDVDMRLRPSGGQGPVATALTSFERYQREEAWVWEHMALTRARVVAGDLSLARDVDGIRRSIIEGRKDDPAVLPEATEMRARLRDAGRAGSTWAVRDGAGGMQDIALVAQALALKAGAPVEGTLAQLEAAQEAGLITPEQARQLTASYQLFRQVSQGSRLLTDAPIDVDNVGEGGRTLLRRMAQVPSTEALVTQLDQSRAAAADIVSEILTASE